MPNDIPNGGRAGWGGFGEGGSSLGKVIQYFVELVASTALNPFYWCNSMYMPNSRVSVCTVRRLAC